MYSVLQNPADSSEGSECKGVLPFPLTLSLTVHGKKKLKQHHQLHNAVNPDVLESKVNTLKLTELEPMLPVMPLLRWYIKWKFRTIFQLWLAPAHQ